MKRDFLYRVAMLELSLAGKDLASELKEFVVEDASKNGVGLEARAYVQAIADSGYRHVLRHPRQDNNP